MEVVVLSSSRGHIDVILHGVEIEAFCLTGFYGNPDTRLRQHSWDLLHQIGGSIHSPQLVEGDFNEICKAPEYFGRRFRPML